MVSEQVFALPLPGTTIEQLAERWSKRLASRQSKGSAARGATEPHHQIEHWKLGFGVSALNSLAFVCKKRKIGNHGRFQEAPRKEGHCEAD
jgi:hypothetical protein